MAKVKLLSLDSELGLGVARAYKWRNSPGIYKWCRQPDVISRGHHQRWYDRQDQDPSIKMYIIRSTDKLKYVGVCGLTSIDLVNRHAEFSLYIAPEFQGNGYGKAALIELCKKGFLTYGLNHIFGESFDGNPAVKMFESVGFKKTGTRPKYYFREGQFIDAHIHSLLSEDFCYSLED